MSSSERPLLTAAEAAQFLWPDLPQRVAARRVYRWAFEHIIPEVAVLRAGRALYLRRAAFLAWLGLTRNGTPPDE